MWGSDHTAAGLGALREAKRSREGKSGVPPGGWALSDRVIGMSCGAGGRIGRRQPPAWVVPLRPPASMSRARVPTEDRPKSFPPQLRRELEVNDLL